MPGTSGAGQQLPGNPLGAGPPGGSSPSLTKQDVIKVISTAFAGGTTAELTFTTPISHDQLLGILETTAAGMPKVKKASLAFGLSAEGYESGSDVSREQWTIRTSLPAGPDAGSCSTTQTRR